MRAPISDHNLFDFNSFLDFIQDYKSRHPDMAASFLNQDILQILERTIKNYKNVFFTFPDSDLLRKFLIWLAKPVFAKSGMVAAE